MRSRSLVHRPFWVSRLICCAGCAIFTMLSSAQTPDFNGRPIREVRYTPVNPLAPPDLQRVQMLKVGDAYRAEMVAEAIDRLFETGLFEDIVVEAELSGDGVAVRFVTQPAKFISGLSVTGSISQPPYRGELTSTSQI